MSEREQPERLDTLRTLIKMGGIAVRESFNQIDALLSERPRFTAEWWAAQQKAADALNVERRESGANRVLLVVAAQHPLVNGREPNEEFKARLCAAAERAHELAALGLYVDIYVPGSRHMDDGIVDDIPLAEAGKTFLVAGELLPPDVGVYGTDLNEAYKGELGVYNSGDEAFVASSFFHDTSDYLHVEAFVGPAQEERWRLHALGNGTAPVFHAIMPESGTTFHGTYSALESKMIAYTRDVDPTWQGDDSLMAHVTRLQRKPKTQK